MIINHRRIIVLLAVALCYFPISAQTNLAVLEKNYNVRAKDLFHDLNESRDSILLRTDSRIKYVYTINEDYKREIFTYVGKNSTQIDISKLSLGKHVMVVNYKGKLIVFVLRIEGEEPNLLALKEEELAIKTND